MLITDGMDTPLDPAGTAMEIDGYCTVCSEWSHLPNFFQLFFAFPACFMYNWRIEIPYTYEGSSGFNPWWPVNRSCLPCLLGLYTSSAGPQGSWLTGKHWNPAGHQAGMPCPAEIVVPQTSVCTSPRDNSVAGWLVRETRTAHCGRHPVRSGLQQVGYHVPGVE